VFAVLGMGAAAMAQSSNRKYSGTIQYRLGEKEADKTSVYGPLFDPSNAPFFGPNSLVFPDVPTPTLTRPGTLLTGVVPCPTQVLTSTIPPTAHTSSHLSTTQIPSSRTTSSNSVASTSTDTSSPSESAQSTNAAVAAYPGAGSVIAGGLIAVLVWT